MPRFKITIEYDGTDLKGWQHQDGLPTVQGILEDAVFSLSSEKVLVHGAGRTDAGVHATGQVAHFDMRKDLPAFTVFSALNFYLRETPVSILDAEEVDEEFHARFSAKKRVYMYRIINRRAYLSLDRHRAWRVVAELDADAMHQAAQIFVGTHDFNSFRSSECQSKTSVKTLDYFAVERVDKEEIRCHVESKSFLHHQVRNMVGTLEMVGCGKWGETDIRNALDAKDRSAAGVTAPAQGLYLVEVGY